MRRYFRFQVHGCQNVSIKTAIRYEDINKIQTEFPRSGMHRGEGGDCIGLFILSLTLMFYRCNQKIVFLESILLTKSVKQTGIKFFCFVFYCTWNKYGVLRAKASIYPCSFQIWEYKEQQTSYLNFLYVVIISKNPKKYLKRSFTFLQKRRQEIVLQ